MLLHPSQPHEFLQELIINSGMYAFVQCRTSYVGRNSKPGIFSFFSYDLIFIGRKPDRSEEGLLPFFTTTSFSLITHGVLLTGVSGRSPDQVVNVWPRVRGYTFTHPAPGKSGCGEQAAEVAAGGQTAAPSGAVTLHPLTSSTP